MENQNNLLKRIKSIYGNHSEMFSMQHAQSNILSPLDTTLKIVVLVNVLRLTQGTSSSL